MQRIKQYSKVSTSLSALSNEKLKQILADGKPMHEGIGGKSALISIDDTMHHFQFEISHLLWDAGNVTCR